MPTREAASRRAGGLVQVGLTLALALTGCSPEGGTIESPADDRGPAAKERAEMRAVPVLPPDPGLVPPDVPSSPVFQDPPAQDRARAALRERLRQELLDAYERHGRKNPRWDGAARQALQAWGRLQLSPDGVSDDQVVAWKAARQALGAGCNDPLIHYLFAILSHDECSVAYETLGDAWAAAAAGMRGSSYPTLMRAWAFARAGDDLARRFFGRTTDAPEAEMLLDEALGLVPTLARESRGDSAKGNVAYHLSAFLVKAFALLPGQRNRAVDKSWEKALNKVFVVLNRNPADRLQALLLRGDTLNALAWKGRGSGPATEISVNVWEVFDDRLKQAEDALSDAWVRDSTCADIPRLMIAIEKGQGLGRDRLELWFNRAMQLNGDDYSACWAKLAYLEPTWHGSEPEMLAFGRECLKTQNWEGRLPFILIEAHRHLALSSLAQSSPSPQEMGYFSRPYVWKDVQAVYEPYLALHPDSHYDKSCYARLAALGGHYAVANRLFEELGDNCWRSTFSGNEYLRLRDLSRRRAGRVDPSANKGKMAPIAPQGLPPHNPAS